MAFASWCACQSFDVRQRLDAQRIAFLRRQFAAEARAYRIAAIARLTSELSPGIARDIAEWRVEA